VLVATDMDGSRRWLRVGGKIDASTGDMLTQIMLGLVPTAMCKPGVKTLIVGHGSGFTAQAALATGAGETDIVELEPAVLRGSRLFHEHEPDPLDDKRVHVHVEDARSRLALGGGRYGLVISEPSNPWIAGENNLFTVDFYRRVRARLAADGVFCQWIQLYELSPATFKSLVASFLEVFPNAHMLCLWRSLDMLLVATPPGRTLPRERLTSPALQAELARARLRSPDEVTAFYVASGAALRALVHGAERNTDDRPIVEYRAPRDLVQVGRASANTLPALVAMLPRPVAPPTSGLLADWPREPQLEWRARTRLDGASEPDAEATLRELRAAGAGPLATALEAEWRSATRRAELARLSEQASARLVAGDTAGARTLVESLAKAGAATPAQWLALATIRRETGDAAGSGAAAERALAGLTGGPRVEALLLAGMAAQAEHRTTRAFACFREAQTLAPQDPRAYDYEARVRFGARDLIGARAAVERGLARVPGDKSLLQARLVLAHAR